MQATAHKSGQRVGKREGEVSTNKFVERAFDPVADGIPPTTHASNSEQHVISFEETLLS